jgi:hypothetical protein
VTALGLAGFTPLLLPYILNDDPLVFHVGGTTADSPHPPLHPVAPPEGLPKSSSPRSWGDLLLGSACALFAESLQWQLFAPARDFVFPRTPGYIAVVGTAPPVVLEEPPHI